MDATEGGDGAHPREDADPSTGMQQAPGRPRSQSKVVPWKEGVKEGFMYKQSHIFGAWQKKYFRLETDHADAMLVS